MIDIDQEIIKNLNASYRHMFAPEPPMYRVVNGESPEAVMVHVSRLILDLSWGLHLLRLKLDHNSHMEGKG